MAVSLPPQQTTAISHSKQQKHPAQFSNSCGYTPVTQATSRFTACLQAVKSAMTSQAGLHSSLRRHQSGVVKA